MAGRDKDNPWGQPASKTANNPSKPKKKHTQPNPPPATSTNTAKNADKFLLAQTKHIESARKHVADYESSSDEGEMQDTDSVLASVFKGYSGGRDELNKTQQFLENTFQSGAATCLICIASVKRADFIWSCGDCHNFFHLSCIQRWANDSTSQKRVQQSTEVDHYTNQGVFVAAKQIRIEWNCPKCRKDYAYADIPRDYECFCGKEVNPPSHPWLIPHSCGELCQKRLQPDCGHRCVLLCHPGPCPPCPQMVARSCLCEQSALRTIRCSQRTWRCQSRCKSMLSCGVHECGRTCHDRGACAPCERRSQQRCECGLAQQERNCADKRWQCDAVCGEPLACGRHRCERRCHADACGPCPRGEPRSCPCGVERTEAPCSEEIAPCGRTCHKTLECGEHTCAERCHKDRCGQCLAIVAKRCRCGNQTRELPCSKQFACDIKCRQTRSCRKHACNRKCCDGRDCPPCDKVCGKTLACGKHKCTALCHQGQCYPCAQLSTLRCRCGQTTTPVLCGRERKSKPPRCQLPCRVPSGCHHAVPHRCHAGECPACQLPCGLRNDTSGCEHPCAVRCHDAVRVQLVDKNHRPAGPWDVAAVPKVVVRKLPHPACEVPVPVTCDGGHETVQQPCSDSRQRSCGRPCGRQLKCGNHRCALECHAVTSVLSTKQEDTCQPCAEGCTNQRPDGCVHNCDKACHLGPCAKCRVNIKISCHCGTTPVYYKCGDFYKSALVAGQTEQAWVDEKERMQSCGSRCTRNYACGHRCVAICHAGPCTDAPACTKKIKCQCSCKTRKSETTCDRMRAGFQLECDEKCAMRAQQAHLMVEEAARRQREAEEEKNRLELLEFEKKFGKRKPKERKPQIIVEESSYGKLRWIGAFAIGLLVTIGIGYVFVK